MKWFKHDTDASTDAKIKKLLIRHGATGYAIYFHCLELIANDITESNLTFELEHDSEIIADNLKIKGTADKSGIKIVEEIMHYIVSLKLFEDINGKIFCFKLLKRLDLSMTSNPNFRGLISKAKLNHDTVMTESCKTTLDKTIPEESKKEPSPPVSTSIPMGETVDSLIRYWNAKADRSSIPRYRYTSFNMSDLSGVTRALSAYNADEARSAINNYCDALDSQQYDAFPTYTGFEGFIRKGIEKYCDDAKPLTTMLTKEAKMKAQNRPRAVQHKKCPVCGSSIPGTLATCPNCTLNWDKRNDPAEIAEATKIWKGSQK